MKRSKPSGAEFRKQPEERSIQYREQMKTFLESSKLKYLPDATTGEEPVDLTDERCERPTSRVFPCTRALQATEVNSVSQEAATTQFEPHKTAGSHCTPQKVARTYADSHKTADIHSKIKTIKKRSKLSGAQYKKRRKQAEERAVQYREQMKKCLKSWRSQSVRDARAGEEPLDLTAGETPSKLSPGILRNDKAPGNLSEEQEAARTCTEPHTNAETYSKSQEDTNKYSNVQHLTPEPIKVASIDPADWPVLTDRIRNELVRRGPYQIDSRFIFPRGEDGRCHHQYFYRLLTNGKNIKRSWLVYSIKNNSVFCFCCKLFSKKQYNLINKGVKDWKNCSTILKSHESTTEHSTHIKLWKELEIRLCKGQTIDKKFNF